MTQIRRRYVIDQETTGLDLENQVTETAYYNLDTDEYGVFIPPHTLDGASDQALEVHGYHERIAGQPFADLARIKAFHDMLGGDGAKVTVTCANPSFDIRFMMGVFQRAGLSQTPFAYRPFDIEEAAYWLFPDKVAYGEKIGLKQIATLCGIDFPNHHEALADVRVTVAVWRLMHQVRETVRTDAARILVPANVQAVLAGIA